MMRALLIMGPTASGKSALALALAQRIGGEIVNADSMQVYRDLRILTARPSAADEAAVPHRLYGHIDGAERFSVGRWLQQALAAVADIRGRGATPIIVGGTGLYFTALTRGLAEIPPIDETIAASLQARLAADGPASLHRTLAEVDAAAAARIQPGDPQRILRALAVFETTGAPLSEWQSRTSPLLKNWRGWVMETPDRAALRAAIAARFDAMLGDGALDEVRALAARALPGDLPVMRALGVHELMAHLRREMTRAEAAQAAILASGQYAKRQETWARGQFGGWPRIAPGGMDRVIADLG